MEISADVDLFGDPIPEGFGKRGRPPHQPTERNRNKVMLLLALGWTPVRIAGALGITAPTLRRHYFFELRARATMRDRLRAKYFTTLLEMVQEKNAQALKELGRLISGMDAAEFGLPRDDEDEDEAPRQRVGKKEAAAEAARSAGAGSDWGDDLLGTQH